MTRDTDLQTNIPDFLSKAPTPRGHPSPVREKVPAKQADEGLMSVVWRNQ
jgi:hypothetical protein